jgi:hypothetical protein
MESLFINAGLAAGAALAAIPVILHLFFRQTPKHVVFPALRLIRERQKQSRKKLKVKNWLLLLARIALIALMALALARPRLWSRTSLGDREIPTALALVFDTSLSMEYKERDRTRLDEAKTHARALLGKTHEASQVFILDSSDPIEPTELTPAAAQKRIDALATHAVTRPLNAAVDLAHKAVLETEQPRRELYVFTDLARSAWDLGSTPVLRAPGEDPAPADPASAPAKAEPKPAEPPPADGGKRQDGDVAVYLVRLSPAEPRNTAVVEAGLLGDFVATGEQSIIRAVVRNTGPAAARVAEFHVGGTKRAEQPVQLAANGEAILQFPTPKLAEGLVQAEIRLTGEPDPLEKDDRRYLSLEVQPPQKVLIVADQAIDGDFVSEALDPAVLRTSGNRPFPVDRASPAELGGNLASPLESYSAVFVLNVARLSEAAWGRLNQFVRSGGGVVFALGDRVDAADWNRAGESLLPGTLGEIKDVSKDEFTFGAAEVAHPLFERNARDLLAELARVPIYRYRQVKLGAGGRQLLAFQNGDPALAERVVAGARPGRVLLWSTALSRRPGATAAERLASWTDFPMPTVGWAFFYLMNQSVPYLAGLAGQQLDTNAGDNVSLALDPTARFTSFALKGPGTEPAKLSQPPGTAGLLVPAPPLLGQWQVTATGAGQKPLTLGFSVNVPPAESQLAVLTTPELESLFGGKDRYALVDDPDKIETVVDTIRIGRELFPWIMGLILLVITLENLLANTFYRERSRGAAAPVAAARQRGAA